MTERNAAFKAAITLVAGHGEMKARFVVHNILINDVVGMFCGLVSYRQSSTYGKNAY